MKHEFCYLVADQVKTVILEERDGRWWAQVDGHPLSIAVIAYGHGRLLAEVDGRRLLAYLAHDENGVHLHADGDAWSFRQLQPGRGRRRSSGDSADSSLRAAMPGRVLDVLVAPGDLVRKGDPLALLEAMKMELRIVAPFVGRVREVYCHPGQVVERGQMLVEIEESD